MLGVKINFANFDSLPDHGLWQWFRVSCLSNQPISFLQTFTLNTHKEIFHYFCKLHFLKKNIYSTI